MSRHAVSWPGGSARATFDRLVAASREVVAGRLADREDSAIQALVEATRARPPEAGIALLGALGRTLGVGPGKLAPRDSLERLFRVEPEDLLEPHAAAWRELAPPRGLDPLSVTLLRELALVAPRPGWHAIAERTDPIPRSDREWIEVMLGLRVDEWVRTWAPVVRGAGGVGRGALSP